eukprot:365459-Chlamydomonas_euryale.AAC.9
MVMRGGACDAHGNAAVHQLHADCPGDAERGQGVGGRPERQVVPGHQESTSVAGAASAAARRVGGRAARNARTLTPDADA